MKISNLAQLDKLILETEAQLNSKNLTPERIEQLSNFIDTTKTKLEDKQNSEVALARLFELTGLLGLARGSKAYASVGLTTAWSLLNGTNQSLVTETARNWEKYERGIPIISDRYTFGPWRLGDAIEDIYSTNQNYSFYGQLIPIRNVLSELKGNELESFWSMGARPEYKDERVYESIQINNYMRPGWGSMLSTHHGKIYKIGLTYQAPAQYRNETLVLISNDLYERFGKSKVKRFDKNQFIYNADDVRVRLSVRKLPGGETYQFNLIARVH